ncbi:MAG: response regulator [Acidobacteria bacterium]|nr:response regulator [Acidobacteriota bacterium]
MPNQLHTILVVDDETINRALLAKLLGGSYNVLTASSGLEAIEILQQHTVALLLTDQKMPGMCGTELLRQARELQPNLVCLLMSAVNNLDAIMDAAVNTGVCRVITKPWNPTKLLEIIRLLLLEGDEIHLAHQSSLDKPPTTSTS